jgi:hypothetical protein
MELSAVPEALESFGLASQASENGAHHVLKLVLVVRRGVAQLAPLHVRPEPFDRVQLRCVGRQVQRLEATMIGQEFLDGLAVMRLAVVPDEDDSAAKVSQQVPHERGNAVLIEVAVGEAAEVEVAFEALR